MSPNPKNGKKKKKTLLGDGDPRGRTGVPHTVLTGGPWGGSLRHQPPVEEAMAHDFNLQTHPAFGPRPWSLHGWSWEQGKVEREAGMIGRMGQNEGRKRRTRWVPLGEKVKPGITAAERNRENPSHTYGKKNQFKRTLLGEGSPHEREQFIRKYLQEDPEGPGWSDEFWEKYGKEAMKSWSSTKGKSGTWERIDNPRGR